MRANPVWAITGGSGFIGRHLVPFLASHASLRLFGRGKADPNGYPVSPLPRDAAALSGIDVVIHMAGVAHQTASEAEYTSANVDLTVALAKHALAAGVRRFIFVSSAYVHGRWSAKPVSPDSPLLPDSPYARSKVEAERILRELTANGTMELVIIRPPLVYGPRAKANFALLARAARIGLPLPLGQATAARSMVSLENLGDAILTVARDERALEEPLILLPADDRDLDVRNVYKHLCRAAHRPAVVFGAPKSAVRFGLTRLGKPEAFDSLFMPMVVDRAHWARADWTPRQSVEQALLETITRAPHAIGETG